MYNSFHNQDFNKAMSILTRFFTFVAKNISKMKILSNNLRYLRARKKLTQKEVADKLCISRGCYAKYEDSKSTPPLETMQKISSFFYVSIDLMVSVELQDINLDELLLLEDNRITFPLRDRSHHGIEIIRHSSQKM